MMSVSPLHPAHGHARRNFSSETKLSAPSSHLMASSLPICCTSVGRTAGRLADSAEIAIVLHADCGYHSRRRGPASARRRRWRRPHHRHSHLAASLTLPHPRTNKGTDNGNRKAGASVPAFHILMSGCKIIRVTAAFPVTNTKSLLPSELAGCLSAEHKYGSRGHGIVA